MDLKNISIEKKELGSLIGAAKRVWTGSKTQRIVNDKIERAESAIFANDVELARLVKAKQELDIEIIDHIDNALTENRGYDVTELKEKREESLIGLLNDTNTFLGTISHADLTDIEYMTIEDIIVRNKNMITTITEEGMN